MGVFLQRAGLLGSRTPEPSGGDPNWNDVVLLLGYEEANKTSIVDASNENTTITMEELMDINTTIKKFGAKAAKNLGGSGFIRCGHKAAQQVGGQDWTLETWFYWAGQQSFGTIIGKWRSSTNQRMLLIDRTSSLIALRVSTTGSSTITAISFAPPQGWKSQWYFVAADYDGTTNRLYLYDPVEDVTTQGSNAVTRTLFNSTVDLSLASQVDNSLISWGYLDESRFTVGTARYTGTLIVPTEAFPRSA